MAGERMRFLFVVFDIHNGGGGERVTANMVNHYLEKIGLGNQGYSPHKLRHTAATLMYQKGGVDIRTLQAILGHSNLGTTQIYTHVADEQIQRGLNANPLANLG